MRITSGPGRCTGKRQWVLLLLVLIGLIRFQLAAYPKCTLVQDFGRLLESNQFTDINFLVGCDPGVVVAAHIALVAARSDWLRSRIREAKAGRDAHLSKLFLGDARPTQRDCPVLEVRLPEADPDAFKMVLDFIYTDQIDPTRGCRERHQSSEVMLSMMQVRIRCQRPELKCICPRSTCLRYSFT